jgi:hypothetical protein
MIDNQTVTFVETVGMELAAESTGRAAAKTLPGNIGFENKRAENGDVYIWIPHDVLARLNHLRGPGESYSDAILALAEAHVGR